MMRPFSLAEVCAPLQTRLTGSDVAFSSVSTDTRTVRKGDLFVALKGENFDGHAFVALAQKKGAVAAIVEQSAAADIEQLCVEDARVALGQLARLNRQQFSGPLVAITGSSGKTTAKTLLAAILVQVGPTLATRANFNNEIGVPQTLLQLESEHRFAVIELGAAREGDIRYLCGLSEPSVAVLLNALPAHLAGFGSVDNVARAKGEIYEQLGSSGTAVINADSPYAQLWRDLAGAAPQLEFGLHSDAAISASGIQDHALKGSSFELHTPQGSVAVRLALPGLHNISNALAAAAAACACGVELEAIRRGLEATAVTRHRLQALAGIQGSQLIDDSYNANPGSVRAAIDVLSRCGGRRLLVLGEMGELGADSAALHREVGAYAARHGIDELLLIGETAAAAAAGFGAGAQCVRDTEEACTELIQRLDEQYTVLIKGSRSARLEQLLPPLQAARNAGEG